MSTMLVKIELRTLCSRFCSDPQFDTGGCELVHSVGGREGELTAVDRRARRGRRRAGGGGSNSGSGSASSTRKTRTSRRIHSGTTRELRRRGRTTAKGLASVALELERMRSRPAGGSPASGAVPERSPVRPRA